MFKEGEDDPDGHRQGEAWNLHLDLPGRNPQRKRRHPGSAPFKEGSLKVAEKSGCPVVPVAITGTAEIFEQHIPFMKPSQVTIEYGKPIYLKELAPEDRKRSGAYTRNIIIEMLKEEQQAREEIGPVDLQECREQLDRIDQEIVKLFEQRMAICGKVAEDKIKTGKAVYDGEREKQKLEAVRQMAHGDYNQIAVRELFSQMMTISRRYQYRLLAEHGLGIELGFRRIDDLKTDGVRVVYQGVEGAYSHAATAVFRHGRRCLPCGAV